MLDNVYFLGHNTIKFIINNKVIYIDPYLIKDEVHDADVILVTHNHYDHFSKDDLLKVKKDDTILFVTEDLLNDALNLGFLDKNIVLVKPNECYKLDDIKLIRTIPAYNINKSFHPKENNWVGYLIELENITYYIVGDSDITKENKEVKCDVLCVPIGGYLYDELSRSSGAYEYYQAENGCSCSLWSNCWNS